MKPMSPAKTQTDTRSSRAGSGAKGIDLRLLHYVFLGGAYLYLLFVVHHVQHTNLQSGGAESSPSNAGSGIFLRSLQTYKEPVELRSMKQRLKELELRYSQKQSELNNSEDVSLIESSSPLNAEDQSTIKSLLQRMKRLESMVHSYLSYGEDPFFASKVSVPCKKVSYLKEYCDPAYKCTLEMGFCMDELLPKPKNDPCIVYDFGIRKEPEIGLVLSKPPFNCQVFAFDPSPITTEWYNDPKNELKNNPNYKLFSYGAGGDDESITLREYSWDQVTIYHYPALVINPNNCTGKICKFQRFPQQRQYRLPVRHLQSIMKELGHTHLTVLKVDIEGGEYAFLERMIMDGSCKLIDQIEMEWHHYDFDLRYGAASMPHLNVFAKQLQEECGLGQFWIHDPTGWAANDKFLTEMGITLRYNLASFMKIPGE